MQALNVPLRAVRCADTAPGMNVSFMQYGLGYFDDEHAGSSNREPVRAESLPMSPE